MGCCCLHLVPVASCHAHECSNTEVTPFFVNEQPLPDAGLGQEEPRLKAMQTGSVDLLTASFTLDLTSLATGAEGAVLVLRDDVVEVFSRRDESERVVVVTNVWLQYSGISDARWECIRRTSVVSSIVARMGKSWTMLRLTATMRSATAR